MCSQKGVLKELPALFCAHALKDMFPGDPPQQFFEQLPVETRAKFGHSFHAWMSSIGTEDFAEKMGWQHASVPAPVPSADVKEVSVSES